MNAAELRVADVNDDGKVNVGDAAMIYHYIRHAV